MPCASWKRRRGEEETGIASEHIIAARVASAPPSNNILREEGKHTVTVFVEAELAESGPSPRVTEPEKCECWRWHRIEEIPRPRFLPLERLMQWHLDHPPRE